MESEGYWAGDVLCMVFNLRKKYYVSILKAVKPNVFLLFLCFHPVSFASFLLLLPKFLSEGYRGSKSVLNIIRFSH